MPKRTPGARSRPGVARRAVPSRVRRPSARPLLAFGALYAGVAAWRPLPVWVHALYGFASLLAFVVYAIDKAAAADRRARMPERVLHAIALAGGWPGALLAQRLLNHKSGKAAFRTRFAVTVAFNVSAFVLLATPAGGWLWARATGGG
jgi:uncharacterized membrane protein YsdA (DUF1294 family)